VYQLQDLLDVTQQKKTLLLGSSSSLPHVKSRLSIYTRVQVSA
jgi:hypothetical protein